ncbi:MAG: polyheme membrane-associated cytochrome C [Brevefilum sp.]
MRKYIWPLLLIFFLLGGLVVLLIGQVVLPPAPRPETVQAISLNWSSSGHSDRESISFTYWDQREPPEIPANCAKCHSTYGYLDYLGEDGSEAYVVDNAAPIGSVVSCLVCHNPVAHDKDMTQFPSGAEIDGLGMSANCAECHQGRRSNVDVTAAISGLPEDEVNEDLDFINIHYKVGGATRFGDDAQAGYQYPAKTYDGFYPHVASFQACTDCHDPHTLLVTPTECAACHPAASSFATLRDIRDPSTPDYDGDGNTTEGVAYEIATLHDLLHETIRAYAVEVIGQPIAYTYSNPKWVIDTNNNGIADEGEISRDNAYPDWTPRLVKATYNYHLVVQSSGAFVHNPRYAVQLLFDSIEDLANVVNLDMSNMVRPE